MDIGHERVNTWISLWALAPKEQDNGRLGSKRNNFSCGGGVRILATIPLACSKRRLRGAEDSLLCNFLHAKRQNERGQERPTPLRILLFDPLNVRGCSTDEAMRRRTGKMFVRRTCNLVPPFSVMSINDDDSLEFNYSMSPLDYQIRLPLIVVWLRWIYPWAYKKEYEDFWVGMIF